MLGEICAEQKLHKKNSVQSEPNSFFKKEKVFSKKGLQFI